MVVADANPAAGEIVGSRRDLDILEHFFRLPVVGLRIPFGVDQSVETKNSVIGLVAKVSAIGVKAEAGGRVGFVERVVGPLPNKATPQLGMCLKNIPIILQVAERVGMGVRVFVEQKRPP